ncbi:hypothetical protein [Amycolatopsis sp. cmx-11-12]|uniref:DUF7878 domain-containing protein n=1 Tax=Amycolatopsis sp. cmx-11-12 TaxID=2785795 RepID=UPI0039183581
MRFEYAGLGAPELKGCSEAHVFVDVEADLTIIDDDREFWREASFPVVELAVALWVWKKVPGSRRKDFEFDSLSLEDRWRVRIVHLDSAWRLVEDGAGKSVYGASLSAGDVDAEIDRFSLELRRACVDIFGPWIEEFLPPVRA